MGRRTLLKSTAALFGVGGVLASASRPARADHYDSKIHYEPQLDNENLAQLSVQSHKILGDGVKLDFGDHDGYVRLFADDFARVSVTEPGQAEYESPGVANGLDEWDAPTFGAESTSERIVLETESITVDISKDPFGVKFLDADGNVVNEDYLDKGTSGYEGDKPYVYKKTDENEAFYGFGEQPDMGFNQRGEKLENWNTDQYGYGPDSDYVYSSVPFFVGLKDTGAYGIFFDDPYHSVFHMADESDDYYYFLADGGQLTYYFAYGPEVSTVLDRYTDLTGKIDLPPKWGIGLHQSKWEYTAQEIVDTAETYREKEIPLDAMHFDIDYMGGEYNAFTWDPDYYDALQTLNADLPELHSVAVNDPGVGKTTEVNGEPYETYLEGTENDYWVKDADGDTFTAEVWPPEAVWPDFSREEVRSWYASQHDALFDAGIDGVKNDMGEPAVFQKNEKYDWTMPHDNIHGVGEDTIRHEAYHNLYGLDYARAAYEAFEQYKPEKRPFLLNRNLFAGGQRYAAIWTGDNVSSWEHLRLSIPMMLNLSVSGMPFVGCDIGGFVNRPSPELFARWMQAGAFNPYCRNHTDSHRKDELNGPRNQHPWTFGEEVEAISKQYIELRYRLLPYLYNAFKTASETGKPVQQPLMFQFQDDEQTVDIDDQFMFGDDMLVAPVLEKGATTREVYLPEDEQWADFWTDAVHEGGQTITVDAPLDRVPLFVKMDSIIPMREIQQYTGEKPLTMLTLDTYLDEEVSYSFYEDDGETRAHENGAYNVTEFTVSTNPGGVVTFEREHEEQNYDDSELSSYLLKLNRSEAPQKVQAAAAKYTAVDDAETVTETSETYTHSEEQNAVLVHIPADEDNAVRLFFNGQGRGPQGQGKGRGH
ncbi:glycoside hydrolase family 31 protein [Halogranum rubrum]|nr:glycoside hydrolase family 31 protein [Halogranum rubrum]